MFKLYLFLIVLYKIKVNVYVVLIGFILFLGRVRKLMRFVRIIIGILDTVHNAMMGMCSPDKLAKSHQQ